MKILIVEDEPKVATFIKKGLEEQTYEVEVAFDGLISKKMVLSNPYDIVILDVNLPQINGLDLCRLIRENGLRMPILMLTAMGTTDDKVTGFEAGADDYLVKPFEFRELLVRLRALHKRATEPSQHTTTLKIAGLVVNLDEKSVKRTELLLPFHCPIN